MLLVPALLIFTPTDFFAVSPSTIDLDKDPKEKKETEKHTSHTSPPPDGFNTVP